jgi:nucleoside-diphosphate-sugar epimerase
MTRARWLVTGGAGFIGHELVAALRSQRPDVEILLAGRTAPPPLRLDLGQRLPVDLPTGIDLVIHLAGEKRNPAAMEAVNHHGTRALAEAAVRAGVRRFVHLSSVGVYGAPKHSGLVDERFPHTPRNAYEASKDAGEAAVREVCRSSGIECVVVQPSNVIGHVPGRSYPLLGLMSMVRSGRLVSFGGVDPWLNYVSLIDVARVTVAAATHAPAGGGTYIVNEPTRLSVLLSWIAEELGVAVPTRRLPSWVGAAAARFGGLAQRLTGRSMPFNPERFLELTNTTRYDDTAMRSLPGCDRLTGLHRTVRDLAKAYRLEGRI